MDFFLDHGISRLHSIVNKDIEGRVQTDMYRPTCRYYADLWQQESGPLVREICAAWLILPDSRYSCMAKFALCRGNVNVKYWQRRDDDKDKITLAQPHLPLYTCPAAVASAHFM